MIDPQPVTVLARGRRCACRAASRTRRGDHAGSAVSPAAALRGPHARRAVGGTAPGAARGGRGRGIAHGDCVSRPAPTAVQNRRRLGIADAAVLLFYGPAAGGVGARRTHPLLRRSSPQPEGPGDGASGISPRRSRGCESPTNTSRRYIPAPKGITQGRLRQLVRMALEQINASKIEDWLPAAVLADLRLPSLREALQYVHRPPADAPVDLLLDWRHPAQRRLAFEELLAHQLSLKLLRRRIQQDPGWPLAGDRRAESRHCSLRCRFARRERSSGCSRKSSRTSSCATPMLRLVQGDVGCGKTLVAALAATQAVQMGRQVALMAPTELLADQHAQNFRRWFEPLGVEVALLTGRQTAQGAQRRARKTPRGRGADRHRHSRTVPGGRRLLLARPGDRR